MLRTYPSSLAASELLTAWNPQGRYIPHYMLLSPPTDTVIMLGTYLLAVCCLIVFVNADFDFTPYPECTDATILPLPKLPPQMTLKTERGWYMDLKNSTSVDSRDWIESAFDFERQRGIVKVLNETSLQFELIWDLQRNDAYKIDGGDAICDNVSISDSVCVSRFTLFLTDWNSVYESAGKTSDTCGCSVARISYVGEDTVRQIPARKWKQCIYSGQDNDTSVNYFYTATENKPGVIMNQPLRFEYRWLNQTKSEAIHFYHHTQDFSQYSETIKDPAIFSPPVGEFCPAWFRENKTIPLLLNRLTLTMITTSQNAKEVHNMEIDFDVKRKLALFVTDYSTGTRFPPPLIDRYAPANEYNRYLTVHDYKSGLAFSLQISSMDAQRNNCTITYINKSTIDRQDPTEANYTTIHVRTVNELFAMNEPGWIYIGERDFNGALCYVWSRQMTDTLIRLTEVYWLKEEYSQNNSTAFFGMVRYRKALDGKVLETYTSVINQNNPTRITEGRNSLFSLPSTCLRGDHEIIVAFTVRLQNYSLASTSWAFSSGMRAALSVLLNVSAFRTVELEFSLNGNTTENEPTCWFYLLKDFGKPAIFAELSSDAVIDNLRKQLTDGDISLVVEYGNMSEIVTILNGTLQTGTDLLKPNLWKRKKTEQQLKLQAQAVTYAVLDGYTSGAMTGLAFAMILIAGVTGAAAGYVFHEPLQFAMDKTRGFLNR